MRIVKISELKSDMVLAKPIYGENGLIWLKKGAALTNGYIEKINKLKLGYAYIEDNISSGIEATELLDPNLLKKAKKGISQSIADFNNDCLEIDTETRMTIEKIIHQVVANPFILHSMAAMRDKEEYLYDHSVNVCIISLLMGKKMNLSYDVMRVLASGALLHDVGKIKIEALECCRQYHKPEEMALYQEHPKYGYEMVKKIDGISLLTASIVLDHHENYDGTGFPNQKKANEVHDLTKIVAIANEYDNLLYQMQEQDRIRHYQIIENIISKAYTMFAPEFVRVLRKTIAPYPVSLGVRLNDGRCGVVTKLNEMLPTRPVVRVAQKDQLTGELVYSEVDLAKDLTLLIVDEFNGELDQVGD